MDDLADEPGVKDPEKELSFWQEEITRAFAGRAQTDPGKELFEMAQTFGLEPDRFLLLIEGMRADVQGRTYATRQELEWYLWRVAGIVGLATLDILGVKGPQAQALARQLGFAVQRRHCSDDPEVIACQLRELLTGCDAVITSGGVSVGQKDYLPAVLERLGAQMIFAGVAQKPGSPMLAAEIAGKLVFCLSGNPFAAAATLEQYAIPALLRAAGRREEGCILPRTTCTLTTGFSKSSKGDRYLRAKAAGGSVTIPGEGSAEAHSSGSLSAMIGCNCLVKLPAGSGPVAPGEEVEVLYFVY